MFGKQKELSFYERESARIQAELEKLSVEDAKYQETLEKMMKLQSFAGKEKESKQIFTKEGRGNIVTKIIGFAGLALTAFGLIKYEKSGGLFSGSSGETMKGILRIGTKLF